MTAGKPWNGPWRGPQASPSAHLGGLAYSELRREASPWPPGRADIAGVGILDGGAAEEVGADAWAVSDWAPRVGWVVLLAEDVTGEERSEDDSW